MLLGALLVTGCSDGSKNASKQAAVSAPDMVLSANDTATVQRLTNDFLELIMSGNVEDAVNSLYVLNGEEVSPLPEEQKEGFREVWNAFDIKGYAIKSFTFNSETDTEVSYALYLKDPVTTKNPPCINGLIQPVRRDGVWYITLANAEGVQQQNQQNRE